MSSSDAVLDELRSESAERDSFLHLVLGLQRLAAEVDEALESGPDLAGRVDVPSSVIDALVGVVALRRAFQRAVDRALTAPPAAVADTRVEWSRGEMR